MTTDELYMTRCLELAKLRAGYTSPNPMVGSVIVHNGKIIGEGYHQQCGQAHAEVNAIASVKDKNLLLQSTIYVCLEPCSHYGKTPPCAKLIIESKIPNVVVGMVDPFAKVNGAGIKMLKEAGCNVVTGVLENECRELNNAFITFQQKKRPRIILKWAQSADNFIDALRTNDQQKPVWLTNNACRILVHKWRSQCGAIMVGYNTALLDNPQLNVRCWNGPNPLRIVTDKNLQLPHSLHLFDQSQPTWIINSIKEEECGMNRYVQTEHDDLDHLMDLLYNAGINQIMVEGGQKLLQSFIDKKLWDEALVFTGQSTLGNGIKSPEIDGKLLKSEYIEGVRLDFFEPLYT